ncbi:MAG: hypothetical protein ACRCUM_00090, partial [Mycoplasmoidaceae bacterium]
MIYKKLNKPIANKGVLRISTGGNVDKDYVDRQDAILQSNIDLKADKTYVDTGLAKKAELREPAIFSRLGVGYFNPLKIEDKQGFNYIDATGTVLIFRGDEFRFVNKRLTEVATPTQNADAANKKYVDDNLNTKASNDALNALETSLNEDLDVLMNSKQDNLVAGDNITITGNVISSTGGGGTIDAYTKTETDNLLAPKADKTYVDGNFFKVNGGNQRITGTPQFIANTEYFNNGQRNG